MKTQELREMTIEDLEMKERDLAKELFNLKLRHSTGQLEDPMTIRRARRDLARVKTILREKRG